mmetsp:Transcript_9254/g.10733  ORF Transcript_9254/g.10733 Transcript_9254/m.10733 type:complete len:105 (+) Transcript_9254:93-407(+)
MNIFGRTGISPKFKNGAYIHLLSFIHSCMHHSSLSESYHSEDDDRGLVRILFLLLCCVLRRSYSRSRSSVKHSKDLGEEEDAADAMSASVDDDDDVGVGTDTVR